MLRALAFRSRRTGALATFSQFRTLPNHTYRAPGIAHASTAAQVLPYEENNSAFDSVMTRHRHTKPTPTHAAQHAGPASTNHSSLNQGGQGRKRYRDDDLHRSFTGPTRRNKRWKGNDKEPRSKAARDEQPAMEFDSASIQRTMELPKEGQYRGLGKILAYPKNGIRNAVGGESNFDVRFNAIRWGHVQCFVGFRLDDGEYLECIGEGTTQKSADHAAHLHLVSKLYVAGFFSKIYGDNVNDETLRQEANGLVDIYDYAARYRCVPEVLITSTKSKTQSRGRNTSPMFEITIKMPEHNIVASGIHRSYKRAEVVAAVAFKQKAEQYQSQQGVDSIVVKDIYALSTATAKQFFQFYRDFTGARTIPSVEYQKTDDNFSHAQTLIDNEPVGAQITTQCPKDLTVNIAFLTAAIPIVQKQPDLMDDFARALRAGNGQYLEKTLPFNIDIHHDTVAAMDDTVRAARRAGLPTYVEELADEDTPESRSIREFPTLSESEAIDRSQQLLARQTEYQSKPDLKQLRDTRAELPMNQNLSKVLDIVDSNLYSIIVGATGSGKTTQVPQILLERAIASGDGAACNIICTQPRRIAATSVARRVAEERAERLQDTVGYNVRFDRKTPRPGGSITYCTTGILLNQLRGDPDDILSKVSHLVIDEVHERDVLIDFLLNILRKVTNERFKLGKPTPKVVLMSATMDSELFSSYFRTTHPQLGEVDCPTLLVPGRTFPVAEKHLESILTDLHEAYSKEQLQVMYNDKASVEFFRHEKDFAQNHTSNRYGVYDSKETVIDWKQKESTTIAELSDATEKPDALVPVGLIAATIAHLAKTTTSGAILVFLPGLEDLLAVDSILRDQKPLGIDFTDPNEYKTYLLHSSIQDSQKTVFDPVPTNCRKIILSTNIAETSITIPEVQYVVDSGKLREKRYDQLRHITKLQCTWVSKSNAKQRAGRAGRVQDGHYYALFSEPRHQSLRAVGLPEILRTDLQETCLAIKSQAFKTPIREFLADSIEPPDPLVADMSIRNLVMLDALTENEQLTALGRLLSTLPVHPSLGKMIVLGILFRCLDPMVVLGAAIGDRSLFVNPIGRRTEAQSAKISFVRGTDSDHIAVMNAFNELRWTRDKKGYASMKDFANANFLHAGAFRAIESSVKQIEEILANAGLIPKEPHSEAGVGGEKLNENSANSLVIKAVALAGFYPNLGLTTNNALFRTSGEKNCMVHPSSVNSDKFSRGNLKPQNRSRPGDIEPKLVSFTNLARANDGHSTFLRDTSIIEPLTAMLFGGRISSVDRMSELDGWLRFKIHSRGTLASRSLRQFKEAMENMQIEAFRDLSKKQFVADSKVCAAFAKGLHDVLSIDKESKARLRNWKNSSPRYDTGVAKDEWL